ncbi:MAG: class II fructose-1,6-bisphosphate aldolase [Malacoplasma sp.]|nr:class II fructose-1,6-bisphosphate aldolase [Malacoplasma sp.]
MITKVDYPFVSMKKMLADAKKGNYAIAHINTNNLEWTKAILTTAQETNTPIIIGLSEGAAKYQCGYKTVAAMTAAMIENLKITVPVVMHLDHGSYDACIQAIEAGFSSVMFDGSHEPFEQNYQKVEQLLKIIGNRDISLEAEVGTIGGEEDGVIGSGELADIEECKKISQLPITVLAAGIGNIHGLYPDNWKGLNFERLSKISSVIGDIGVTLHGGTGIPDEQIKKAIELGVVKINVNTECQVAFQEAVRKYIEDKKDLDKAKKGFDPRKLLKPGYEAIKSKILEKITLFGSLNKA